nr:uncharacterized protein CTRU02_08989 [Colletotrichum truncatum]KAF6789197.1 hypothetical protein CTRU02_08989 [Colletotrichum truncatum]
MLADVDDTILSVDENGETVDELLEADIVDDSPTLEKCADDVELMLAIGDDSWELKDELIDKDELASVEEGMDDELALLDDKLSTLDADATLEGLSTLEDDPTPDELATVEEETDDALSTLEDATLEELASVEVTDSVVVVVVKAAAVVVPVEESVDTKTRELSDNSPVLVTSADAVVTSAAVVGIGVSTGDCLVGLLLELIDRALLVKMLELSEN